MGELEAMHWQGDIWGTQGCAVASALPQRRQPWCLPGTAAIL